MPHAQYCFKGIVGEEMQKTNLSVGINSDPDRYANYESIFRNGSTLKPLLFYL